MPTQQELAAHIAARLRDEKNALAAYWQQAAPVRHFYLDGLLPEAWAQACFAALPQSEQLMQRHSDKERKRVGIELEKYDPLMGAILFAFQDAAVIAAVADITGLEGLVQDPTLYGSGISMMEEGDYLLPHLDNSHDGDGKLYRVLNTLYYITPHWPADAGGNLELWDKAMKERKELHSAFNRLVVMQTDTASVHSVNKVTKPGGRRACISNYYFSAVPVTQKGYVHKTTFYARPEDGAYRKMKLELEGTAKNFLSKWFGNNTKRTKHRRG